MGGLSADFKKALVAVFSYVLKDIRAGRPGHQMAAENLRMVFVEGTTSATPDTEFSIEHGLERAPYLLIPIADLQGVGSQIVPLFVTRAADDRRVYLSSPTASAAVSFLIEG